MIVFISGGARSGKSHYAEEWALSLYHRAKREKSRSPSLSYLATGQVTDQEMNERIARHQVERGFSWSTIEEPYHIEQVIRSCKPNDVLLLDCVTIWLSNMIFELNRSEEEIMKTMTDFLLASDSLGIQLFIVSNDVNEGMPSTYPLVNEYIRMLGRLHQHIVQHADQVIQVIAGIPYIWKGVGQ